MNSKTTTGLGAIAVALTLAACSSAPPKLHSQPVGQADFPGTWPLTVEQGVLGCNGSSIDILVDGRTFYAVNGAATDGVHKPIDPIWADDPATPGLKMSLAPLIAAGLKLC